MYGNFEIGFCFKILSELMPEKYAVDRDDMKLWIAEKNLC